MKEGFKCGVAMFRCATGLPITSYRVTCSTSFDDAQELIDHVHFTYVIDSKTKEKKTRLYCYGASLGAIMLGLQCENYGSRTHLDGAVAFGLPFDIKTGSHYFYNDPVGGFYSWIIGMSLSKLLQARVPELSKHCSKEEGERINAFFSNNRRGLKGIDEELYLPMFGYKTCDEYYKAASFAGSIHKVQVPMLCLSAQDDFVAPFKFWPTKEFQGPDSNVLLACTKFGGHATFLSGRIKPVQWFQEPIMEYLNFLELKNRHKFE